MRTFTPAPPALCDSAPLAAALLATTRRETDSFHALPASRSASVADSAFGPTYQSLFGSRLLDADVSYSGVMLDSFFRPRGPLREAQRLAARAFGADASFFLSTGTSTANRVALAALTPVGGRVLADRTSHQSIHFALADMPVEVDYAGVRTCCEACPRVYADLPSLLETHGRAAAEGRPYDTVVLSALSYDGVRYDLPRVLAELAAQNPGVSVLVDEAWGAIHNFHPELRGRTALEAARRLREADAPLQVAVTHSAHKTMSSLRQGSYLHLVHEASDLPGRVAQAMFRHHTTSPSLPILASLDLARLQAEFEGEALVGRSLRLTRLLEREISTDPALAAYRVIGSADHLRDPGLMVENDPLRVMVDTSGLGISAGEVRRVLFDDYSLYAARESGNVILFHLHIGTTEDSVGRLLAALRDIQRTCRKGRAAAAGEISDRFIIAYPPGIPIAVPGEQITDRAVDELGSLISSGCEIYTLDASSAH